MPQTDHLGLLTGSIVVETHKWQWLVGDDGRVIGEGAREDASDAF
jgi:hypothetical protein